MYDPRDLEVGDVATVEHFCDCENCEGRDTHIGNVIILETDGDFLQPSISVGTEGDLVSVPYKHKYRRVGSRLLDHKGRELRLLWVGKGIAKSRVGEYERIVSEANAFDEPHRTVSMKGLLQSFTDKGISSEHPQIIKTIMKEDQLPTFIAKTYAVLRILGIEATETQVLNIATFMALAAMELAEKQMLKKVLFESIGFSFPFESRP